MLFNSPEGSPSASSTVAEAASPAPLADARVLPVSVVAEAGASLGRAVCLGRWRRVLGRAGVLAGRCSIGPVQQLWLRFDSYLFALLFHSFVLVFKNLYCLVYRSKCYGSNFVKFLVMSSI